MGQVLRPTLILSMGFKWLFLYQCLTCLVYWNYIFIQNTLWILNPIEQEMNMTSDDDVQYSDKDLLALPQEELICHMKSLEWEQDRLRSEVGRTCPPFWDRYK